MTLHGNGRAHGAVTVVNAIPAGQGAAFGIELATEATVDLEESQGNTEVTIQAPGHDPTDDVKDDHRLVHACLEVVGERAGVALSGTVETESQLPIARGLKSSSVAANALILALLDALDEPVDAAEVLDLGVEAARRAGVTVTGALDDAAASLLGGLALTDNREDVVEQRKPIQTDPVVLLLVPATTRYTQDTGDRLAPMAGLARRSMELARQGSWQHALTLNGLAVATCLDEPLDPTYRALGAGAMAAGTTGTGPAVAAVCHRDDAPGIREAWDRYDAEILATHPTNQGLAWEGSA